MTGALVLALADLAGADIDAIFRQPGRLELFSIDPGVYAAWGRGRESDPSPLETTLDALEEGDGVHGSVVVEDKAERKKIVDLVFAGIANPARPARCYEPRHALLASKGEKRAVIHICFACNYVTRIGATTGKARYQGFADAGGLQDLLNRILKRNGIRLARDVAPAPKPKPKDRSALAKVIPVKFLDQAEKLELYSISPDTYRDRRPRRKAVLESLAAGKGVLGKMVLKRAATRRRVLDSFYDGWGKYDHACCYEPRHALVATRAREHVVIVFCFQCTYVVVLDTKTERGSLVPYPDRAGLKGILNSLLRRKGIKLAD